MSIICIRTDNPEAELKLYRNSTLMSEKKWTAHRQLGATIHVEIRDLLSGVGLELKDIEGIVVYKGPGSFTGLRIGLSVANALASSLNVPIVGTQTDEWYAVGVNELLNGNNEEMILPEYGAPVHITEQKK